jgi:glycosyltransferase involved in cell wall biosynthesis
MITGTGKLRETLQQRAAELELGDNVRFLGHVTGADLPDMYRASDLSIAPSLAWEGFGLSVAESLACGTPVIVTPVGGLPEVVSDLSADLVLRDRTVGSIAVGLLRVLKDRSKLPGREACAAYARRFAWPVVARQVASVYREIV